MTPVCPKCNYARQLSESTPDYECPSCGLIYAKFRPREQALKAQAPKSQRVVKPVEQASPEDANPSNNKQPRLEPFKASLRTRKGKAALWVLGTLLGLMLLRIAGAYAVVLLFLLPLLVSFVREARKPAQTTTACPACGATVAFGAKVCPRCGKPKPAPKPVGALGLGVAVFFLGICLAATVSTSESGRTTSASASSADTGRADDSVYNADVRKATTSDGLSRADLAWHAQNTYGWNCSEVVSVGAMTSLGYFSKRCSSGEILLVFPRAGTHPKITNASGGYN